MHRKGTEMAYLLTHFWPGGTEAEYRATVAAATDAAGGTLPESFHAAGPTDGGYLIAAVYESKDACDRFVQETLMPLMPIEGGLVGPPQERGAEIVAGS
jgi:selenophosphate synthase